MNAVASLPANLDLARVIEERRTQLTELETLQRNRQELDGKITMILTGTPPVAGKATPTEQIRTIDKTAGKRQQNAKSLGAILSEHLIKAGKGAKISVREAVHIADAAHYKSNSKNLYNVARQCLVTDKRFRKSGKKGIGEGVRFALAV